MNHCLIYHYKDIYSMINSPRSWHWRLICLTVSDVKIVEKGIIKSLKAKKRIKKERMNYHPVDMKVGCWYLWINPLILWTHTLLNTVLVFVFYQINKLDKTLCLYENIKIYSLSNSNQFIWFFFRTSLKNIMQ